MNLVLDASAALAWLFLREKPAEVKRADRLLDAVARDTALVPALWHHEICNALLVAERRKVATEAATSDFLARLSRLPIETDTTALATRRENTLALARSYKLSVYDACYLDLALRSGSVLASFDMDLVEAMHEAGGKVFE